MDTELVSCCRLGQYEQVAELLKEGADACHQVRLSAKQQFFAL